MEIIKTILIIAFILVFIIGLLYIKHCKKFILNRFKIGNCIVYGAKGKGKDLLFQYVVSKKKHKKNKYSYIGNVDYGYNGKIVNIRELDLKTDYKKLLDNKIEKVPKINEYEGLDYYFSDSGIYLPCHYNDLIDSKYKSLPILYATSRHLYNMNIHCNVQSLSRLYLKIREQADSYFKVKGNIKLLFGIIVKVRYYEKYESANTDLNPLNSRLLNKYSKAEVDLYNAKNGIIKDLIIYLPKKNIYYDTRYFETLFFENIEHKKDKKGHYIR